MNWIRGSTGGCPIWRDITGSGVGIVENIEELVGLSGMGKIQGVVDTAIGGYGNQMFEWKGKCARIRVVQIYLSENVLYLCTAGVR